jgi:MFS family permease
MTSSRTSPDGRDFRVFWVGGAVSRLGTHATALAMPILVLAVGGSVLLAGVLGTVGAVAEVLLTPFAGVLADRGSRRAMMVGAGLLSALAMAAVAVGVATGVVPTAGLFAATVLQGVGTAGFQAAATASIRALLPPDGPERALASLQAREQGANLVGPAFGGALYQLLPWLPFLVDAVSYLVAAVCARLIRTDLRPVREPVVEGAPVSVRGFRREFSAGLGFLWRQRFLRFVALWSGGVNLVFGALSLAVVLLARTRGDAPGAIGVALSIAGAAGLLGALAAPRVLRRVRPATLVVWVSWLMAAAVLPMAVLPSIWADGGLLGVVALLCPSLSIIFQSKAITDTPDGLQGRVGTVLGSVGEGTGALAPLLAGLLVRGLSPAVLAIVFCAALAVLAVYATAGVRALRPARAGTPGELPTVPEQTAPEPAPVAAEG